VTRKTQFGMSVAAAVIGLAVVTALWLTRPNTPPPDDAAPPTTPPAASDPTSPEEMQDPRVLAQVRQAYQQQLAQGAPPGMIELMEGGGPAAGELPPLPDPFVVPAGYRPESAPAADLPPLPPDLATQPELLPPPDESPAPKAGSAADELPPLPPNPPR
jgi:hypothetical protein